MSLFQNISGKSVPLAKEVGLGSDPPVEIHQITRNYFEVELKQESLCNMKSFYIVQCSHWTRRPSPSQSLEM